MPNKIMFVMPRTMGDVIVSTTIIKELMCDNSGSEIYFFTNKPYGELLKNNPNVFKIIELDKWELNSIFLEMVSGKYDFVYAPYQVKPECNMWHQFEETRHQHLVDFYWQRMGKHRPITERECYLFPTENDFARASELISFDVPRIAVHSTTGVSTKDWPYFKELTDELRNAGYCTIQVGADSDNRIKGAIDFRGRMSFMELAAFLSKCVAFVGLDSGVSYIADAMKVPTIVIQGSTDPVTSGPISDRVTHLFAKETGYNDCETIRCHMNCRHEMNCITKVNVDDVLNALKPILERHSKPIPAGV